VQHKLTLKYLRRSGLILRKHRKSTQFCNIHNSTKKITRSSSSLLLIVALEVKSNTIRLYLWRRNLIIIVRECSTLCKNKKMTNLLMRGCRPKVIYLHWVVARVRPMLSKDNSIMMISSLINLHWKVKKIRMYQRNKKLWCFRKMRD